MNLALLGVDSSMLAVLRAALASGHSLTYFWPQDAASAAAVRNLVPGAQQLTDWEALIVSSKVEALLVSRGIDGPTQVEQLRKLIQAGVPLLLSHPLAASMLEYYELDMIRRETNCPLVVYLPETDNPGVEFLSALVGGQDTSTIGAVEQLLFERSSPGRNKDAVLSAFMRDIHTIQTIVGPMDRVSALGGQQSDDAAYANLGVTMSGASGTIVRWTTGPAAQRSGATLSLIGDQGAAVLSLPDAGPWELTLSDGIKLNAEVAEPAQSPELLALTRLHEAMAGRAPAIDCSAAARSVELAEAVQRSLLKGRTIELHGEVFSESGTFKGTMTSVGCGLLLAAMGTLFFGALAQTILANQGHKDAARLVSYCWIGILLTLLLTFLAFQFLLKVARGAEPTDIDPADKEPLVDDDDREEYPD